MPSRKPKMRFWIMARPMSETEMIDGVSGLSWPRDSVRFASWISLRAKGNPYLYAYVEFSKQVREVGIKSYLPGVWKPWVGDRCSGRDLALKHLFELLSITLLPNSDTFIIDGPFESGVWVRPQIRSKDKINLKTHEIKTGCDNGDPPRTNSCLSLPCSECFNVEYIDDQEFDFTIENHRRFEQDSFETDESLKKNKKSRMIMRLNVPSLVGANHSCWRG